jgi:catechol 2,3-dioxygenase-like lactoylglutathione lyase family enzyme
MAITALGQPKICSLLRFGLTTANADRLTSFYESVFGCRQLAFEHRSGSKFERLMAVEGGAASVTLALGDEVIELLQFDQPGRPYPSGCSSFDLVFQHFAIVVTNMEQVFRRLSTIAGWTAITSDGPQHLPARSGGVTAFKFRDPDGHPLELVAFDSHNAPPRWRSVASGNPCLGIDHSAISVLDSARSIHFYEGLGFRVSARTLNTGVEQERLDRVGEPRVEVTALRPVQPSPHLELLCYRGVSGRDSIALRSNDVAATRLVLEARRTDHSGAGAITQCAVQDPDGHHLLIVAPLAGGSV